MDLELGPSCCKAMPSPQPTSPSHRNPLALLSKLKHQLSKAPTQHRRRRSRRQQPIEHQYLPIPTVSFSESLHSTSSYSCSNHSSSTSSFVFIDHNEEPGSFGVDEYRPFLPLIIQHERRLAAVVATPPQRKRIPPPIAEPPSPTSTASSKSPVTPSFTSHFFRTDDVDDIMTLSNSEVGSISEYSLPRSLSPYMSSCQVSVSNSESEPQRGRVRAMSIRIPPPPAQQPSKKSLPPAPVSPPPSWPLPEPPVSRSKQALRPRSAVLAPFVLSDSRSRQTLVDPALSSSSQTNTRGRARSLSSANVGLRKELAASPPVPALPIPTLSPAICLHTKNTSNTTSVFSDSELSSSNSVTISMSTSTSTSASASRSPCAVYNDELSTSANEDDHQLEEKDGGDDGDDFVTCPSRSVSRSTCTSISTPTTPTPKKYGIGRQVVRGSGCDFGDFGRDYKRNSKRMSYKEGGMRRSSVQELTPESVSDSKVESGEDRNEERKSSIPVEAAADLNFKVKQDCITATPTRRPTRRPTPPPISRRRVKSDDSTNPSTSDSSRRTTHRERKISSEWTLFLGVPRNATPPVPPLPAGVNLASSSITPEPSLNSAVPKLASTVLSTPVPVPAPAQSTAESQRQNHSQTFLPTHLPATITTMTRNRTKSDSALLTTAAASCSGSTKDHGKAKTRTKTKMTGGGEDWTLSLPLVNSSPPPTPSALASVSMSGGGRSGRGSKYFEPSSMTSGSVQGAAEEVDGEMEVKVEDSKTVGLVITVEDVDCRQGQKREVSRSTGGEYKCERGEDDGEEEEENSLVLRVPRIVRSCSSSFFSSVSTDANPNNRTKKGSTRWMGATSTPNLRARGTAGKVERLSSSMLEEEVMSMLLGNAGNDDSGNPSDTDSESKVKSKSKKDLANALVLAQKRMATLDEDLARFNALLKNGNDGGSGRQPSSTAIDTAAAAVTTKTKTVTLNSHPSSIPTSTSTPPKKSIVPSSQTLSPIKPVLKHAKSCEPFLESYSSGGVGGVLHSSPPGPPGPVLRFPSSTGRGDLSFFDELDHADHGGLKPTRASLRLSRSAEWIMGELRDSTYNVSLPPSVPIPSLPSSSSRASPPPPSSSQQQGTPRTSTSTCSISSTQTVLLPFASSLPSSSTSTSASSSSISHNNTKYFPSSACNLMSKGGSSGVGVGVVEIGGAKRVPPISLRTSSIKAVSRGSLRTSTTPAESSSDETISYKSQIKPGTYLPRIHTSSFSSSSSSSGSSSSQQRRIIHRRSISPPLPPSPIPSESSSTLPTPLASAFPLPPCSPGISSAVVAVQQKLREFECARERHLQQQQQRNQYLLYKPPSTASSVTSLVSSASSTATVVPSGGQKMRMRERGENAMTMELEDYEEADSMCSGTYYTARSSFSNEIEGRV